MRYELKHDKLAAQIFVRASAAAKARRRAEEIYVLYQDIGKDHPFKTEDLEYLAQFFPFLDPPEELQKMINESQAQIRAKENEEKIKLEAELKEKRNLLDKAEEQRKLAEEQSAKAEEQRKLATLRSQIVLLLTAFALGAAFLAWNQTRKANGNAKAAVDALLKVAKDAVCHLEYEEALPSLLAAAKLEQNKTKVAQALQEIAFVSLESGQKLTEAAKLISLMANLLEKTPPIGRSLSIAQMRQTLKQLDAKNYNKLMKRYFPVMINVAGGTFQMGCDSTFDKNCQNNEIQHTVQLSRFELSRTEATFWQWGLYCAANRLALKDFSPSWGIDGDNPAVNVDWYDGCAYANWLSSRFDLSAAYAIDSVGKKEHSEWEVSLATTSNGFRLPTEAEWEYAARGGSKRQPMIYSGSDDLDEVANNDASRTYQVATNKNNQLGFYDMSGNVYEWCWDWYGKYDLSIKINPIGPNNGSYRVLRGGSCGNFAEFCRVANRSDNIPYFRLFNYGFRLARTF